MKTGAALAKAGKLSRERIRELAEEYIDRCLEIMGQVGDPRREDLIVNVMRPILAVHGHRPIPKRREIR